MMKFLISPKRIAEAVVAVCVAIFVNCMFGCAGGGTSGSGGGAGLQFSGSLRLSTGGPAAGVTVVGSPVSPAQANAKSANTAVTDNTGAFTIFVDAKPSDDVALSFHGSSISSSFLVTKIPTTAAIVKIDLTYDEHTSSIKEDDVKYENEDGGEVKESSGNQGHNGDNEGGEVKESSENQGQSPEEEGGQGTESSGNQSHNGDDESGEAKGSSGNEGQTGSKD